MVPIASWVFNDVPPSVQLGYIFYTFHLQLHIPRSYASIPRPTIPRNNLVDPKTYSLCGISSSWSARTLPSSASKIVIKNPNKILWSIASTALLSFPLISTDTYNTTTGEVVSMAALASVLHREWEIFYYTLRLVFGPVAHLYPPNVFFSLIPYTVPRPD